MSGDKVNDVELFKYLGSILQNDNGFKEYTKQCIKCALTMLTIFHVFFMIK